MRKFVIVDNRIHINAGTADADMEFPDCMQCKNCCNDYLCEKCGPEYGWAYYARPILIDIDDELSEKEKEEIKYIIKESEVLRKQGFVF